MSGTLVLVVGPSGAGKDTLIGGAARALAGDPGWVFPRRVITRPEEAGGEDHVAVDSETFDRAEEAGAFALSWRAHDLAYGIPGSIAADLRDGRNVVVNVSRTVIDRAHRRFPRVQVVAVTLPRDELLRRLTARGRETGADIETRLARAQAFDVAGNDVHTLDNSGTREESTVRFVAVLRGIATP